MRVLGGVCVATHSDDCGPISRLLHPLCSEIEVKDNGIGNWLINPVEAEGLLEELLESCCHGNTDPDLPLPVQGGDLDDWLAGWLTG